MDTNPAAHHATAHHPTDRTPTDRLLLASLVIAPPVYLLADILYAARGWDDGDAGGVHVIGAVLYGFVALCFASWATGRLQLAAVVTGVIGTAGNVAYGFNTIHVSLGAVDLVDATGPAAIIKPLGLFFPLSILVWAMVIDRSGRRPVAVITALAAAIWPIAHIANIAPLAVVNNLLLVVALVPLAFSRSPRTAALTAPTHG